MLAELKGAFKDVFSSHIRGLLWLTALSAVLVFLFLFFGVSVFLTHFQFVETPWIEKLITVLGYLLFFIMALMLFPAAATFVAGFFIDAVVDRTAAKANRTGLKNVPLAESIKLSGLLAVKGVIVSGLLIPVTVMLGFIPFVNFVPLVLYYGLNGRLLAREYFFTVAMRYKDFADSETIFDRFRTHWIKAGIIISFLMTVPVVNIISPLVAVAFMQRLFLKKLDGEEK